MDRNRQIWLRNGCEQKFIEDLGQCSAVNGKDYDAGGGLDHLHNHEDDGMFESEVDDFLGNHKDNMDLRAKAKEIARRNQIQERQRKC